MVDIVEILRQDHINFKEIEGTYELRLNSDLRGGEGSVVYHEWIKVGERTAYGEVPFKFHERSFVENIPILGGILSRFFGIQGAIKKEMQGAIKKGMAYYDKKVLEARTTFPQLKTLSSEIGAICQEYGREVRKQQALESPEGDLTTRLIGS